MLAQCLDRLVPGMQSLDASLYEVIVTDDGKNNEAKALIETSYPWIQWTAGPKRGPAANRNNGAKHAAGEWLVFTDDDCLPEMHWLHEYYNAIHKFPDCKAYEGAILPDDWNLLKKDMAECPVNDKGGCFWSANIMVQRELFGKAGGFDEQFKIAAQEDQDLQTQVSRNTNIVFVEKAKIIHPVRIGSLLKNLRVLPARLNNWILYEKKYKLPILQIWKKGVISQTLALFASIRKLNPLKAVEHVITLLFCFIFIPYYASRTS